MTIGLVFLSVMMACIVWWLMRQTINVQPWEAQASSTLMHAGEKQPSHKVLSALQLAEAFLELACPSVVWLMGKLCI